MELNKMVRIQIISIQSFLKPMTPKSVQSSHTLLLSLNRTIVEANYNTIVEFTFQHLKNLIEGQFW